MTTLDVVSIATNGYTKYWLNMITSFQENNTVFEKVVVHVLTDDLEFVTDHAEKNTKMKFVAHQVESMPWPLPTLMRYEYISRIAEFLKSENILYIDSDMIFHPDFDYEMEKALREYSVNLVVHPGYWRPHYASFLRVNLMSMKMLLSDFYRKLKFGGLGAWETCRKSTAYVKRRDRNVYVCGGVWFGERVQMMKMVNLLKLKTEVDLRNRIIAKWHDESHLNNWLVSHGANLLNPSFCFDPRLSNLSGLKPLIEAVVKGRADRI